MIVLGDLAELLGKGNADRRSEGASKIRDIRVIRGHSARLSSRGDLTVNQAADLCCQRRPSLE